MKDERPLAIAFQKATKVVDVSRLSWDAVSDQIRQSLVEVSNGLIAERLLFTNSRGMDTFSVRTGTGKALSRALTSPYRWAVRCYWVQDDEDEPVLIMLSTRRYNSYKSSHSGLLDAVSDLEASDPNAEVLYRLAFALDNRSLRHTVPKRANVAMMKLRSIAQSDNILLAALAAEILTHQGSPTLPMQAIINFQQKAGSSVQLNGNAKHVAATFEKRINVDDYNFFELVHPAYFRQTVALAGLVAKFVKTPFPRAIDVGPGPGTNLLAFQELMPDTQVLAIEPSDVAFQYLQGHFSGNERITCLQEDFLSVPPDPEKIDYIMSTGASHHFNTDGFLQRSMEWLRPGGYWFIADEMISPFETRNQRSLNLLRHHLSYMTPLCFPWSMVADSYSDDVDIRTNAERAFVDDYNRTVPHAKFYADNGDVDAAEALCRGLLARTEQYGFTTKVSDPKLAFWRLQWLELQALVAGLDYEVEQKTYPQHFIKMAEGAGLICVAHERVYGTVGLSDDGAGTHVMAFQKA
ncbi:hypothetical protein DL771_007182 [Monosporascus sp. 5C6A]|nr:hypothetical protein DL771_007182 [Monosporascus sp. 5C6A]